ncbi:hypothetical protein BX666DRAFT_1219696 [Dichotomocladium elegans]|nr:hypothetical protein BX666DRAFT_1219696 [Dichotomocladium elegans]
MGRLLGSNVVSSTAWRDHGRGQGGRNEKVLTGRKTTGWTRDRGDHIELGSKCEEEIRTTAEKTAGGGEVPPSVRWVVVLRFEFVGERITDLETQQLPVDYYGWAAVAWNQRLWKMAGWICLIHDSLK